MEDKTILIKDLEYEKINKIYDECLTYLESSKGVDDVVVDELDLIPEDDETEDIGNEEPSYETIEEVKNNAESNSSVYECPPNIFKHNHIDHNDEVPNKITDFGNFESNRNVPHIGFKVENELKSTESISSEPKSERLRKLSQQLPKIIITQSSTSLDFPNDEKSKKIEEKSKDTNIPPMGRKYPALRNRGGYGDFPKRLVSKSGMENVALISNVPSEKIRLLNDTFHTLINLRWRWIVMGTVFCHFAIWLVFAMFWYITALAHYDFEPDPPKRTCITGGKDFVTIFLASVEAQTTIGFGDRAIDEECPESIFLFIMQLILGTGLSGVLTCVVYAKITRPEKLSRDGVGFSKKAVISLRDGRLCLMFRAWDLNYDHIISSEFCAHFITTYRTKEGETVRYYARQLPLQQRQFLLWPVTLVHVIDDTSPLYTYTPDQIANNNYEITIGLKGASASMGTFTQSQTSFVPKEVMWGHRFLPVVKYDIRKQKYVIDHHRLNTTEPVTTPYCSAKDYYSALEEDESKCPGTPSSFSEQVSAFTLGRSSSFRRKGNKS